MSCKRVFIDSISNCNTFLEVNALLEPATPYDWVLTDKFENEYSGTAITNGEGFLDIDVSLLPAGLFTPYSGMFTLQIFEQNTDQVVDFKMAKFYDAIEFDVVGGSRVKASLGVDFSCTTPGGGAQNSAVFPFTAAANVVIPWTTFLVGLYGNAPTVQVYQEITPGVYQLVTVPVTMVGGPYALTEIDIDNGGPATGYVLVS